MIAAGVLAASEHQIKPSLILLVVAAVLVACGVYLLLERARFGERLQVNLQIGPEVLSTVIPFLSLQPLVENAVRHGLESRDGTGHITISAHDAGTQAEVIIEDDGVGMASKNPTGLGTNIASTLVQGELGGTLTWDDRPGGGTRATLDVYLDPLAV